MQHGWGADLASWAAVTGLQTACAGLDLGPRPTTWGGHPWDPAAWAVHAGLPDPELDRWYAEWSASTAAHRAPLHLAQASWELGSDGWRHDPRRGPTFLDAVERCGRPVDREVVRRLVRVLRWAEAFRGLA